MDYASAGSQRMQEHRSGGKMVRSRRAAVVARRRTTPYDRPAFQNSVERNPNWVSRFIYSPTRKIASGAAKLLASVFVSDSSSSSSSIDSASDGETEVNNGVNVIASLDHGSLHKMIKCSDNEPKPDLWKNETKHVIEQLLLQETYSREECDRFTNIVKSRVVDHPNTENAKNAKPGIFNDVDMPDISNEAVLEARKWLEEKNSGSNLKSKLQAMKYEVGSPVFVAKSYMRTRPLWASPSADHVKYRSPSLIEMPHFQSRASFSVDGNSSSSSKLKLGSLSAGLWSIQDELRRVRSKATEEMLKNLPSKKIDLSPFSLEHSHTSDSPAADKLEACEALKIYDSAKAADDSLNLGAGVYPGFQVTQDVQDNFENETFRNPAPSRSLCNQDMEADKATEVAGGASSEACAVVLALKAIPDSQSLLGKCSTSKEVAGTGGVLTANGFPSPETSSSVKGNSEPEARPAAEESNQNGTGRDEQEDIGHMEMSCKPMGEASIEVPGAKENEVLINEEDSATQNSSSIRQEALEEGNQDTSKVSRQSRRGRGKARGRGKGRGQAK